MQQPYLEICISVISKENQKSEQSFAKLFGLLDFFFNRGFGDL